MSQWPLGDSFRSSSLQNSEVLQSWSYKEDNAEVARPSMQAPEQAAQTAGVRASSFHQETFELWRNTQSNQVVAEAPLALRFEPPKQEPNLATRLDYVEDRIEHKQLRHTDASDRALQQKEANKSPLSRIYDILDVHSASSRWLEQRGYLEAFKSPNCTLDLSFSTQGQAGKVGAVVTAPDGSKRTVIACEGGTTFQRLTASDGRELVKFLSSGQIVELNPQNV